MTGVSKSAEPLLALEEAISGLIPLFRHRCIDSNKHRWVSTSEREERCVFCGSSARCLGTMPAIARDPITDCWLWTGRLNNKGYGVLSIAGKETYAHRWMYVLERGPFDASLDLDHLCRVPQCVNPEHLEPVTHAENIRRGANAKITAAQVEEIRRRVAAGERQVRLAREFGLSSSHVSRIVSGRKWAAA